jgi:hypothetical protein
MSHPLKSKEFEHNRGRPKHVRDFDWNAGLHNLRDVSDTPERQLWATPLWHNLLFLVVLGLTLWAATFIYSFPEERLSQPESLWSDVLRWTGVTIFAVAAGLSGLRVIHRGRLVLNRRERTLCFYYLLGWPRVGRQLSLDEIVALNVRALTVADDDESPPWTYRIVVAELRDGRLASIAFDSTPGIAGAIRDAMGV